MSTKETVSLCMIVKDEADCLLAAIQSVRALTDEVIVIDTGSTDGTAEIALAAGAKLFHVPWTQDFAVARNFALKQASSQWILVLDADEILEAINPEAFDQLLDNVDVEGYFLRIKNDLGPSQDDSHDQVVRLFRNKPVYQFEGPLHEQIAPSILRANDGHGLASVPLTINHYGYLKNRLQAKDKFVRNSEIIQKELARNPDNPFLLYSLGLEYYQQDSITEGLGHLNEALGRMSGNEGYFEDVLLNIALGYLRLEEMTHLLDFINKALTMYPDQLEFLFLRGTAYLSQQDYCNAVEDFKHLLELFADRTNEVHLVAAKTLADHYLLLALKEIHLCSLALEQNMKSLSFNPKKKVHHVLKEAFLFFATERS